MSVPPWRKSNRECLPAAPTFSNCPASYTAVATKTTLSRPPPPAPQAQETPADPKTQWPESLKLFVSNCFDQIDPKDTPIMETQLKEVITKAFELGSTWTIDWSKATLPILELRKKEKKRLLAKDTSQVINSKKQKTNNKKK